jgi:hypothetical protein
VTPRTADAIRKVLAYGLATVLTLLLFRVLSRVANGRQTLGDVELWATLVLAALGFAWVRAARRVRRAAPGRPDEPA